MSDSHTGKPSGMLGKKHKEETKQRIREKIKGMKRGPQLEFHKKAISESVIGKRKGIKLGPQSEEHRQNISKGNRGKHKGKKNSMYGKKHKEETKQKQSEAAKARWEIWRASRGCT